MRKILIADDHILIRKGLIEVLQKEFPAAVVTETDNAEDLLIEARKGKWDLVITDINMPGRSGIEIISEIKQHAPSLPVLVLSMFSEDKYALRALRSGASGYINKLSATKELTAAINTVMHGKKYITHAVAEQLANFIGPDMNREIHTLLTNREFEIFKLIASGKSLSAIAGQVNLSPSTISTYRSRIMKKMQLQNNAALTFYSVEHNLI